MSFWEWLGEMQDPGPRGKVEFGDRYYAERSRTNVLLRLTMAVLILAVMVGVICWLVPLLPLPRFQAAVLLAGLALIYVSVSYFVHPEPDDSNIGWLGGLVDNPMRWSDDFNRWLHGFDMLLAPGRMVAEGFLDFVMWRRARREAGRDEVLGEGEMEGEELLATHDESAVMAMVGARSGWQAGPRSTELYGGRSTSYSMKDNGRGRVAVRCAASENGQGCLLWER